MIVRSAWTSLCIAGALLTTLLVEGCAGGCVGSSAISSATLTVHLVPEHDVAQPETVTVCQESQCDSTVIPPLGTNETFKTFVFTRSQASATLTVEPGGVRQLVVWWPLVKAAFDPKNPHNQYRVTVGDSAGNATGGLDTEVAYTYYGATECSAEAWVGSASD